MLMGAVVVAITTLSLVGRAVTRLNSKRVGAPRTPPAAPAAHYVGTKSCETCHSSQAAD